MEVLKEKPRYKNVFVGVTLAESFRQEYDILLEKIKELNPKLSLSSTNYPHIVLLFMGDRRESEVAKIIISLKNKKKYLKNISVRVEGLSYFKNNFPRVIYLKVNFKPSAKVFRNLLSKEVENISQDKKRKYKPHLTLARLNGKKTAQDFLLQKSRYYDLTKNISWSFPLQEIVLIARDREEKDMQKILAKVEI
jgi:2'-5' RNA ligase